MYTYIKIILTLTFAFITTLPANAKSSTTLGLSAGQYRIQDNYQSSYWMQHISAYVKYKRVKAKVSVPYLQQENGEQGIGNGLLKVSWLNQWQGNYVDAHLRQRLATANEDITLPVHDQSVSLEMSRILGRIIGFIELGHWWREKTKYEREDTFFSSVGAIHVVTKKWVLGGVMDHRPTAYGEIDRTATFIAQHRLTGQHKLTFSVGKGLESDSPDWTAGVQWQYKLKY